MSITSEISRLNDAKSGLRTFLSNNGIDTANMTLNEMVNALGNLPKWKPGDGLALSADGVLSVSLPAITNEEITQAWEAAMGGVG